MTETMITDHRKKAQPCPAIFGHRLLVILVLFLFSTLFLPITAHAGLIRDAEIEDTLREYANPIFKSAGLKPSAVDIYIVQDSSLNAFVAGGSNLFIHTGLILATDSPDMLLGVIAHETGHMAGGHLAKGTEKLKDAQLGTIMSAVLGAAAAVATGKPEAAAAVMTGTNSSITRNYFSFSRANENAADQAGLGYLDKLRVSADGMVRMFELLKRQERTQLGRPDPYLRTHPLTNERIEFVRNHAEQHPKDNSYSKKLLEKHARMVAKLAGFLDPPEKTLRRYSTNDASVAARMARAIAFFKQAQMAQASEIMLALVKEYPSDPYLHDTFGQILFESGRTKEALENYRKASSLLPNNTLILIDLAKSELAQDMPELTQSAIAHLERSVSLDNRNSFAFRLLATAYGKQGNQAQVSLALAEESLLIGDVKQALSQSNIAMNALADGPAKQRAKDVHSRALQMKKEQDDAKSVF